MKPKLHFTAVKKDGTKKYWVQPSRGRISSIIASGKFKNYVLRVVYGKAKCAQGCICEFDNEMKSSQRSDIQWAMTNFLDKQLYL